MSFIFKFTISALFSIAQLALVQTSSAQTSVAKSTTQITKSTAPSTSSTTSNWRALDAENTLIIDTSKGRLIIEMRPEFAPKAVERIKLLAREKVYDGLQFHRVIAGFVAQTGNPNNRDGGVSTHPNLAAEFLFTQKLKQDVHHRILAAQMSDGVSGLLGSVPFQAVALTDEIKNGTKDLRSWGAHCTGVAGMGRGEARDSANSELYFMLAPARRLDKDYTVFGRIVMGMDALEKLQVGEPPAPTQVDTMQQVRVMADMAVDQRPKVRVLAGAALSDLIKKTRLLKGADFTVCDINIPTKIE